MRHPLSEASYAHVSQLNTLTVSVTGGCDERMRAAVPTESMKEEYTLEIANGHIHIAAPEVWGAMHALNTVVQLAYFSRTHQVFLKGVKIEDSPRFPFRSFLIDTSRHYISTQKMKDFLEAMAFVKMNIFHWHIVDDPSFPFESSTYPGLSGKGAYDPSAAVYTIDDVKDIIEFGRLRGIRVMSEFDTPGHTQSWGKGYPHILAQCFKGGMPNGEFGPVDPSRNSTYEFMRALFNEVTSMFPKNYLHLGGDEVDFACWQSNPNITTFVEQMQFGKDYKKLESYYIARLLSILQSLPSSERKLRSVVWQEVFNNAPEVSKDVTVHVWIDSHWDTELRKITAAGHEAVFSACWYLNVIGYGEDWPKYYTCDPGTFTADEKQRALLKGGGATMWSEYVDETNLLSRSWPRGAPVAERLWSPASAADVREFRPRMEEIRCRFRDLVIFVTTPSVDRKQSAAETVSCICPIWCKLNTQRQSDVDDYTHNEMHLHSHCRAVAHWVCLMKMQLPFFVLLLLSSAKSLIPKPLKIEFTDEAVAIPITFNWTTNVRDCFILNDAIKRFNWGLRLRHPLSEASYAHVSQLNTLTISITDGCDERMRAAVPTDSMKEEYTLEIANGHIHIAAPEVWGAMHALNTVVQLAYFSRTHQVFLKGVKIEDSPRFPFRSFLIDTSRHYISTQKMKDFLVTSSPFYFYNQFDLRKPWRM
ncbi:unnamed protein product [Dibothriocephalus latus]|uniref:beta-N-acetylhexosaminidase n=1 Tax=Dibothriocephalus latus TaxID=60516 RepID=A0A3P6TC68_DIBLA|nr:unnamed protein product [Dibothriocephalus latus]